MRRLLAPAEVVLAGPPNAGKSTLGNALVGRPVSIVHDTPGTTRDWVRELAILNGLPVWVTDTAGLWRDERGGDGRGEGRGEGILPSRIAGVSPARDANILSVEVGLQADIEEQSARRALERIGRADVVLLLGQPPADMPAFSAGGAKVIPVWTKADACSPPRRTGQCAAPEGASIQGAPAHPALPCRAGMDRPSDSITRGDHAHGAADGCPWIAVSAKTGEGMDFLRSAILRALGLDGLDPAVPRAFTERQASLLQSAAEAMERGDAPAAAKSLDRLLQD